MAGHLQAGAGAPVFVSESRLSQGQAGGGSVEAGGGRCPVVLRVLL